MYEIRLPNHVLFIPSQLYVQWCDDATATEVSLDSHMILKGVHAKC